MERPNDKKNPWVEEPNSVDVEMTAYALLTYLQRGLVEDGLPILHWLVSQQNEQGGFASSQVHSYTRVFQIYTKVFFVYLAICDRSKLTKLIIKNNY